MGRETIELTQRILGMKPYVLIEADTDPADGELVLSVAAGGGAADQLAALPFMMLTQMAASENLLTQAAAELLTQDPAPDRETLRRFADYVGFPMPEQSGEEPS